MKTLEQREQMALAEYLALVEEATDLEGLCHQEWRKGVLTDEQFQQLNEQVEVLLLEADEAITPCHFLLCVNSKVRKADKYSALLASLVTTPEVFPIWERTEAAPLASGYDAPNLSRHLSSNAPPRLLRTHNEAAQVIT